MVFSLFVGEKYFLIATVFSIFPFIDTNYITIIFRYRQAVVIGFFVLHYYINCQVDEHKRAFQLSKHKLFLLQKE